MNCQVTNNSKYSNFEELYKNHNIISSGYKEIEVANTNYMRSYYSKEDQAKYGLLKIELKVSK